MSVIVELKRFSGPMDLLLYLIRKEEMDIFDINIHEITQQYLDSIKQMKKLNLESAGDFIAMAATLIQIKAKMLVPQYNEDGEVVEEEDPRKDLVQKLLEYEKFKEAGQDLYDRPLLGRDMLVRGTRENFEDLEEGELIIEEENALYALIAAYRSTVKRKNKAVHKVSESLKSIRERIMEIRERLSVGRQVLLSELIEVQKTDEKSTKLITFLSLLELAKIGLVSLFQSENFADIHVEAKSEINEKVISDVENYEAHRSDAETENKWMMDSEISIEDESDEVSMSDADDMPAPEQMNLLGSGPLAEEAPSVEEDLGIQEEAATDEEIELALKEFGELDSDELDNNDAQVTATETQTKEKDYEPEV